jgi:hypothetical protein
MNLVKNHKTHTLLNHGVSAVAEYQPADEFAVYHHVPIWQTAAAFQRGDEACLQLQYYYGAPLRQLFHGVPALSAEFQNSTE